MYLLQVCMGPSLPSKQSLLCLDLEWSLKTHALVFNPIHCYRCGHFKSWNLMGSLGLLEHPSKRLSGTGTLWHTCWEVNRGLNLLHCDELCCNTNESKVAKLPGNKASIMFSFKIHVFKLIIPMVWYKRISQSRTCLTSGLLWLGILPEIMWRPASESTNLDKGGEGGNTCLTSYTYLSLLLGPSHLALEHLKI